MTKSKFFIAGIDKGSIVDGEGWRYVIFFQGCKHHCDGCHNPETWDFEHGNAMTVEDIVHDLEECNSNRLMDITFSGGDPFFQAKAIVPLAKELKALGYNIWAYTGFSFDNFLEFKQTGSSQTNKGVIVDKDMIHLLSYIDVVVDGAFEIDKKTLDRTFVGSSNQRIVDVKKSLRGKKVILYNFEE